MPEEIKIQVLKYYNIFLGKVNKHIDTELNPLKRKKKLYDSLRHAKVKSINDILVLLGITKAEYVAAL